MRLIWLSCNQRYPAQWTTRRKKVKMGRASFKGSHTEICCKTSCKFNLLYHIIFKTVSLSLSLLNVALKNVKSKGRENGGNMRLGSASTLGFCDVSSYTAWVAYFSEEYQKTFAPFTLPQCYCPPKLLHNFCSDYCCDSSERGACVLLTWGKVMLMRLNLLCSLLEITILPPPGGPMDASRCIPCWVEQQCIDETKNTN